MDALQDLISEARREFAAGRLEETRLLCLAGLSEFPDSSPLLSVLGWVYAQRGDLRNAETSFRHALCRDAQSFDTHAGLAAVLAAGARFVEAESHHASALALRSDDRDTLFNYGCTLIALRRFEQAIDRLQQVLRLDPSHMGAIHNLAIAHAQVGRWDVASEFCDRALEIDREACHSQVLRGMAGVALGSFAKGWEDYDARCRLQDHYSRQLDLRVWGGESDTMQSLVVVPEQGIGTQLLFASCLPDLIARVPRVTIACDPRLVGLLKRSFPSVNVVADGLLPALSRGGCYDAYIMAGSLPRVFRRSAEAFSGAPYLAAEPALQEHWRARLAELGSGLKVGVSWGGGEGKPDTLHRRTDPRDWQDLCALPNAEWINLQFDAAPRDTERWRQIAGNRFHDWNDFDKKYDLENFAALVSQLDLVITVVNSTVHFSGSLGTPTWTLVPAGGEWRWQTRGVNCLWHKSVRLFRQRKLDDWSDVFSQLQNALAARLHHSPGPRGRRAA